MNTTTDLRYTGPDDEPTEETPEQTPERTGEEGQGLVEYALVLSLIAVVAVAALVFLGTSISSILSTIGANIAG